MPKISVIIPVYNVEKYLRMCLDSVIAQTFTDWQVICVNDGSPDNCDNILDEYASKDSRFIVLNEKHLGPSVARNLAMKHATGKYIMFLDSDDFIHPQTMEIAYHMACRDNSDVVAYTYHHGYRFWLKVLHWLKINHNHKWPCAIRKKYNINNIKTVVTDDVFEYATEHSHNKFNKKHRWLIKHCHSCTKMYRRDFIVDIPFIPGILFEDFPWWSEVMLKTPRVTIVNLPFYFYRPNFGGIVLASNQMKIMESLCVGIKSAYIAYCGVANDYQMKKWSENFLWCFINWAFRKVKYIESKKDCNNAHRWLSDLRDIGAFDNVPNNWYNLREDVYKFLGEDCAIDIDNHPRV